MDIRAIAGQIIMLLLIAGVGLVLRHRQVLNPPVIKGVNTIVLKVAWPAMVLMAAYRPEGSLEAEGFLSIFFLALLIMVLASLVFGYIGIKWLPKNRAAVFASMTSMPNAGFVGLPIVQALYGEAGVLHLSAYIIAFSLTQWTVGYLLFAGKDFKLREVLANAGVLSALLAVLLFVLDWRLPEPLYSLCRQLGSLTTPLAMLLAGGRLYEFRLKHIMDASLWVAMLSKLLLIPIAAYLLLRAVGIEGMALGILVLATAMPSAVSAQMFAERFEHDSVYGAAGVSLSLLLCLATIPLLMGLLPL